MTTFTDFFLALLLSGALLLVFRALALWYWKVNPMLEQLQRIEHNTARVAMILAEVHREAADIAQTKAAGLKAELEPAPGSPAAYQLGR